MTDITPAARQMAAALTRAEVGSLPGATALARLCARFIAMQEDMAEIDRFAIENDWRGCCGSRLEVAHIAAKYRAEPDPLVEALKACNPRLVTPEDAAAELRAELAKRGIEIGKAKP